MKKISTAVLSVQAFSIVVLAVSLVFLNKKHSAFVSRFVVEEEKIYRVMYGTEWAVAAARLAVEDFKDFDAAVEFYRRKKPFSYSIETFRRERLAGQWEEK